MSGDHAAIYDLAAIYDTTQWKSSSPIPASKDKFHNQHVYRRPGSSPCRIIINGKGIRSTCNIKLYNNINIIRPIGVKLWLYIYHAISSPPRLIYTYTRAVHIKK